MIAWKVWTMKNKFAFPIEGKKPVLRRKVRFQKSSIIGTAKIQKHMNNVWNNNDTRNCANENFAVASVIIDSICSFVSVNLAFNACSNI